MNVSRHTTASQVADLSCRTQLADLSCRNHKNGNRPSQTVKRNEASLCGSEDATSAKEQDPPPFPARVAETGSFFRRADPSPAKSEINWVQLGREVYARYWEVRNCTNRMPGFHSPAVHTRTSYAARDASKTGIAQGTPEDTHRSDANAAHIIGEVLSNYTLVPPSGSNDLLPSSCASIGSLLHDAGICKPCVFANKNAKTCRNQAMCYFCHHLHKERRKKRYAFRSSTPPDIDSPLPSPDRSIERRWQSPINRSKKDADIQGVKLKARGGGDSLISTAPSTTRGDRQALRRPCDRKKSSTPTGIGIYKSLKWPSHTAENTENALLDGHATTQKRGLVNRLSPTLDPWICPVESRVKSPRVGAANSGNWDPLPEPDKALRNRDAIIAALLLGRSIRTGPEPALEEETLSVPPATSRTAADRAEFWHTPSAELWPSPATSREGYQSLRTSPLEMEFADEGWWEQEMLGTLITSLLVSSSPQVPATRTDVADESDDWKAGNLFCQVLPGTHYPL
eukprot:Gregarina_sp_Poly_1__2765@NODE_1769_length_3377_cov_22_559215_g1_i2_p1_GENE_NODE_1769_length_3377_cov_22_559215_g1_i2NODE_1769_length_3377_cov_22_559215_g1_i2_p1_ORF_typecomplete_len512_score66_92zfP11/PF03854_14/0_24_NODE_1769_length_3377_cov_22_559215_g1_i28892424